MRDKIILGVIVLVAAIGVSMLTTLSIIHLWPQAPAREYTLYDTLLVGAIHVGSISDMGYNQAQHQGLLNMARALPNVRLVELDNIPETEAATTAMESLIDQGATVIFAQSYGYLPYALKVAQKHHDVIFMHPAGNELADNLGTYWSINFEAAYLTGIVAGRTTKTNQLGYVAALPIPNILATVNAFQLGARSVNEEVTTQIIFTGSWVAPDAEREAVNRLADRGADVIAMLVDSPLIVVQTAEERGVYSVGFHSASLRRFAPKGWLTGVAHNWGPLFIRIVTDVQKGAWQAQHMRGGIETDMVQLAHYGSAVDANTQLFVEKARLELLSGEKQVFVGPLYDNAGALRIQADDNRNGLELMDTMDWLVEGVIQYE